MLTNIFTTLLTLFLLGWPLLAAAEPVYLHCTLTSSTGPQEMNVTVDASTGKVTQVMHTGKAFTSEGLFTADTITYQHTIITGRRGFQLTNTYQINRRTLALHHTSQLEWADKFPTPNGPHVTTNLGNCDIITRPENKL